MIELIKTHYKKIILGLHSLTFIFVLSIKSDSCDFSNDIRTTKKRLFLLEDKIKQQDSLLVKQLKEQSEFILKEEKRLDKVKN